MGSLLIVGASARAAAASARRAGFKPWCADLFADSDLRNMVPDAVRCPTDRYPHGLAELLASAPVAPWIYTGGLENHPKLISQMAAIRPLWGSDPEALRLSRDPFAVQTILRDAGLPALPVRSDPSKLPTGCRWLRKPRKGSAGQGITFADSKVHRRSRTHFYQQYVEGAPMSAVFVRARGTTTLLGVTEQLIGIDWLNAPPFRYCGNIGPADLTKSMRTELLQVGRALGEGCGLLGLFGVDFIAQDGRPWVVEVNPRYPASVEVLELATGMTALSFHQQAFDAHSRPKTDPGSMQSFVGKAIFYAARRVVTAPINAVSELGNAILCPECVQVDMRWAIADIPAAGESVEAGWPVLTILAADATREGCMAMLKGAAEVVSQTLL
jgi:predicted ATP-grasp superfamily ATP-dependent carboligase